jgi:hypothetical protein
MENFFVQLKKWREENPDYERKFEQIVRSIEKSTAFVYQPLVMPYLEVKTTERTPSVTM